MNEKELKEMLWVLLNMWAHTMGVMCWLATVFMAGYFAWFHQLPVPAIADDVTLLAMPLGCIGACAALRFKLPLVKAHVAASTAVIALTFAGWMLGN